MPTDVRSHRFISHFPATHGARLAKLVKLVRYPHKAEIFPEDAAPDFIYLVFTGRVALMKNSPGGAPHLIAYKGPDDYFGELGVLDGSRRSTGAVADGPVLLGRIAQKPFLELLAECSWHTVLRLFSYVSENLRATNSRYVTEVVRKEKMTLIGEMANGMIHDFRGPFTTITLATESIAKHDPSPRTQEMCGMVLRQVKRLGTMVEEVLEFSRGETRLQLKPQKLQDVFDQLRENVAASLARTSIGLTVRRTKATVLVDSERLQRVLQNLVSNAREAMAKRGRGRIAISARTIGKHCQILVADNGPGIPREIRATLFEPFVTHGKVGGTGLGLAIAKSVVEAHHGSIDVRTSRAGTTFIIQLPLMP